MAFATQASASSEFLCNAWSGEYSNGKPFILKKEASTQQLLKFKDLNGNSVTAKYVGKFNPYYAMYLSDMDKDGHRRMYYFNDTSEMTKQDALLYMGYVATKTEATCHLK